jgi:hypothetical protein
MGVLLWLFALEPIMLLLFPAIGKYFLTALVTAIVALDVESEVVNFTTDSFLSPLTAALFLLGYAVVFAILALVSSMRRDID